MERRKNIFVVGLDGFHRDLLDTVRDADRYDFHGLVDPADIVRPNEYRIDKILSSAKRTLDGFGGPIDAIVGWWDFPTSTILPNLRRHCGLPGPTLEAVLRCEHKFWSRREHKAAIPDNVPRFAAFNPFDENPGQSIDLEYPFWIKPIKGHSSYLAFKIRDDREFADAIATIRRKIEKFARPFNAVLEFAELPPEIAAIDGHHCLAEEMIEEHEQCTIEGYILNGEAVAYGTVDSVHGGKRDSTLRRYQYPSHVPPPLQARMAELAGRVLTQIGFDQSPFNAEFFYDERSGSIHLLEMNPRISKSHSPLFLFVDGASHQQVAIQVALGERPSFPRGKGRFPYARKIMMRHYGSDAYVRRAPHADDIREMKQLFPELLIRPHVHEGMRLSDLHLQESYSYELADIFLGGEGSDEIEDKYARLREMMPIELDERTETKATHA